MVSDQIFPKRLQLCSSNSCSCNSQKPTQLFAFLLPFKSFLVSKVKGIITLLVVTSEFKETPLDISQTDQQNWNVGQSCTLSMSIDGLAEPFRSRHSLVNHQMVDCFPSYICKDLVESDCD